MQYDKIIYPDGQISIKITGEDTSKLFYFRINSYQDLFTLLAISEVSKRLGINKIDLYIPCLFGQRSDRRFSDNQSFDLKLITDIVNQCKFKSVTIFDPHSDVSLALITNSYKDSSLKFVELCLESISIKNLIFVAPDAGAYKKVFEYGQKLNFPVMGAVKHRDKEGKVDLVFTGDVKDKDCLIIDDLCSRGRTFIELSRQLKKQGANKIYLYVSHFEGGMDEYKQTIENLKQTIDHIFTTNSFREFDKEDKERITIFRVL